MLAAHRQCGQKRERKREIKYEYRANVKQERNQAALTLSREYEPMARDHGYLRKNQETQHKHKTPRRPVPPYDRGMCEGILREKGHL